jgi:hypothetical protein
MKMRNRLQINSHLKTDEYSTTDLGLSAALLATGFELISLNKQNPNKVVFIFTRKTGIDEAIKDYWNNNLKVDAQGYFNAIKRLKNQIYSG